MDDAVDLIQRTVDINAIPILSKNPERSFVPGADGGIGLMIMADIVRSVLYEERKIRRFSTPIFRTPAGQSTDKKQTLETCAPRLSNDNAATQSASGAYYLNGFYPLYQRQRRKLWPNGQFLQGVELGDWSWLQGGGLRLFVARLAN